MYEAFPHARWVGSSCHLRHGSLVDTCSPESVPVRPAFH